jgi:hypothetical protein
LPHCVNGHLDRFAFEIDVIDKVYSQITTAPPIPETKKTPFTVEQIEQLWTIENESWVDTVINADAIYIRIY